MTNSNNLKQMSLACHSLADVREGVLPPVYIESWINPSAGHLYGGPYLRSTGTVFFFLLPNIEQDNLFRSSVGLLDGGGPDVYRRDGAGNWNNGGPGAYQSQVKTFQGALDETAKEKTHGWGVSSFACNYQVFGRPGHPWGWAWGCMGSQLLAGIKDGTSNTILFAEKRAACSGGPSGANGNLWGHGWWNADWMPTFGNSDIYGANAWLVPQVSPINSDCEPFRATAFTPSGCQVGMGDGSVKMVAPTITQQTWNAAMTPNGREVLPGNW